jgi:putative endopeptidase
MTIDYLTKITLPDYSWGQYLATGVPKLGLDWKRYFKLIGKPVEELGDVNVAMVKSMKKISSIYDSKSLPHYLTFHSVNSYASSLPIKFVDAKFNFFDKELQGTSEQRPRWKRSLSLLENSLGEAIGQFYVAKYFDESAKARALSIVEKIRDSLRERLGEVKWMSDSTREQALKKMEGFKVKIGYPDEWIDYSSLNVINGQHMKNLFASHAFDFKRELKEMNAPTDKKKWHLTPQTINAYYHPSMNEIVFPAAILQAPFFDKDADDAVNFGSMGAVVGHEMTHGFDDQGRKYNYQG